MPLIKRCLSGILIFLLFSACLKENSENKNKIVIAFESAPATFDPRMSTDVPSSRISGLLFNGLVKFDRELKIVPDLSTDWKSEDGRTYIFHLRRGVFFHSGETLTSSDVVYTYKSILSDKLKSPLKGAYDFIEDIQAVDDYTVKFTLNREFAPFLSTMTTGIVPAKYAEKAGEDFGEHPSGTGPFRLESVERDREIRLSKNERYFEEGVPKIDGLVFKIIRDESIRALQLEKGDINFCENVFSPDTVERLSFNNNLNVIKEMGTDYYYIGINMKDKLSGNLDVRKAIAHGIDRNSIIRNIEKDGAVPATGLLPQGHWAYEGNVEKYEYDPERSKKLLDEAGFKDPDGDGPKMRLNLTFKTTYEERSRKFAEVFQEQMRKIGIGIDIRMYEWATFYNDIKGGNFQLFRLKWVGVTDPDHYYEIFNSGRFPPAGKNRGFYSNSEIDRLTEEGRKTMDIETRRKIYSDVQKIAASELPYISLWHAYNIAVLNRDIKGFLLYPRGEFDSLKYVYIEKQ